jgi:high affinity sulfate transporter 1
VAEEGGVAQWVPGLRAVRNYQRGWLRSDLVAGLVLAAILVPQGMAYAELAGLPPVTGLYTTVACLVGYAIFGPSRILVLGPDSSVSPLILAAITPLLVVDDPGSAIALAGMLAILVGLIEIGLGLGKLGFVADLLSNEVQIGYMNGLAITIIAGQLPKLFGFSTDADSFVEDVREFFAGLGDTNTTALLVGLAVLATLWLLPRITRRIPAILVAVVGATLATAIFGLGDDISTVGTLPRGVPTPDVPWTEAGDLVPLFVAALGITLVSLTDTIALATSFAARRGDEVDANQEMIGMGAANAAAGFFQGFAVSSSSSRTAVAEQSGAKSQLAGVVGAGLVLVLLAFLNSLLSDLPQTALAAVVIAAAVSLANIPALLRYAQVRRSALVLSLAATAGVVFLGVLEGIVVGARPRRDRGVPLGGSAVLRERDLVPGRGAQARPRAATEVGRRAVRGDHRYRRHRGRGARAARRRIQQQALHYGLLETLDRDHFYPTIDAALAAIRDEPSS